VSKVEIKIEDAQWEKSTQTHLNSLPRASVASLAFASVVDARSQTSKISAQLSSTLEVAIKNPRVDDLKTKADGE